LSGFLIENIMGQIKNVLLELAEMATDFFEENKFRKNKSKKDFKNSLFPKTYKDFIKSINRPIHVNLTLEQTRKFAKEYEEIIIDTMNETDF